MAAVDEERLARPQSAQDGYPEHGVNGDSAICSLAL